MSGNKRFEFESIQDPKTIRNQLDSILEGLEKGQLFLAADGREIMLTPGSLLKLTVRAKRKDEESRLSIKVSWKDARREENLAGKSITIRS